MRSLTCLSRRHQSGGKKKQCPRGVLRTRLRSRWVRMGLASLVGMAVLGSGGAYLWYAGYAHQAIETTVMTTNQAALDLGLGIAQVKIRGLRHARPETVQKVLNAKTQTPIFAFDPVAARSRLLEMGWVDWATVSRRFPNTIYVDIRERQPFALWQNKKKLRLIGRDGTVITTKRLARFRDLPLIVGAGANTRAGEIIDLLAPYADLEGRIQALTLVGQRRWNIRFDNGVDVRLPEQDTSIALERLAALQTRYSILDRKLRAIDLRMPDRLIVQLMGPIKKTAQKKGKNT